VLCKPYDGDHPPLINLVHENFRCIKYAKKPVHCTQPLFVRVDETESQADESHKYHKGVVGLNIQRSHWSRLCLSRVTQNLHSAAQKHFGNRFLVDLGNINKNKKKNRIRLYTVCWPGGYWYARGSGVLSPSAVLYCFILSSIII